ncbi:DUF6542 domain-containing protein [Kitasatospora sp. NPDC008115]|uniref:DUF6542 domain-containing protein n=1 Tax=Kitasatospora sp. NPDC008115 TaxID=3364022 RepID=UPI0036ED6E1F
MAGRRARTSEREVEPRPAEVSVPGPRAAAEHGGRAAARRAGARRSGGALPALLAAVGLPPAGAVAGELAGHGGGPLFAAGAVLGTGGAALLCGRAGRWWVVIAAPPVVLAARAGTAYLAERDGLQGKALASAAVRWVVGAFPVMAAAVVAALLAVVVRVVLDRRAARRAAPAHRTDHRADRRRTAGAPTPARRSHRG